MSLVEEKETAPSKHQPEQVLSGLLWLSVYICDFVRTNEPLENLEIDKMSSSHFFSEMLGQARGRRPCLQTVDARLRLKRVQSYYNALQVLPPVSCFSSAFFLVADDDRACLMKTPGPLFPPGVLRAGWLIVSAKEKVVRKE